MTSISRRQSPVLSDSEDCRCASVFSAQKANLAFCNSHRATQKGVIHPRCERVAHRIGGKRRERSLRGRGCHGRIRWVCFEGFQQRVYNGALVPPVPSSPRPFPRVAISCYCTTRCVHTCPSREREKERGRSISLELPNGSRWV